MTIIEQLFAHWRSREFGEALAAIEIIEAQGAASCDILVLKGQCLQLDRGPRYTFEDIEATLLRAIELDPSCQAARIELAYYYLNVLGDNLRAREAFHEAAPMLQSSLSEFIIGLGKSFPDCESQGKALDFVRATVNELIDEKFVSRIVDELGY